MDYQKKLKTTIGELLVQNDQVDELHQLSNQGQLTRLDYEALMSKFKIDIKIIALLQHYIACFPHDPDSEQNAACARDLEQTIESTADAFVHRLGLLNNYLK